MKIGDMVRDLAAVTTSRQRKDDIIRQLNELGDREEKYSSWLSVTNSSPQVQNIAARTGEFIISPIEAINISRQSIQSIPNNVETVVSIDGATADTNFLQFNLNKLYVARYSTAKILGLIGWATWASNVTGYRTVHVRGYRPDDSLLFGQIFTTALPTGAANNDELPCIWRQYLPTGYDLSYLRFLVYQNSGGALDLKFLRMAVFALR